MATCSSGARFRALFTQFADRVASEPGVAAVTFGAHYPNSNLTEMPVEVDGVPLAAVGERAVQTTSVATDFLETFDAPLVAGRPFTEADAAPGQNIAIVDQTFVRQVLGGQEAVGRRLRHAAFGERPPGPWIEIVGVVKDLTDDINKTKYNSVVYRPAAAETHASDSRGGARERRSVADVVAAPGDRRRGGSVVASR